MESMKDDQHQLVKLMVLREALMMEMKGLRKRGRSAYVLVKGLLGVRGSRKKVLLQLDRHIRKLSRKLRKEERNKQKTP